MTSVHPVPVLCFLCLPAVRVVRYVRVAPPGRDGLGQVRDEHGALAERLPRRLPRQTPLGVIYPSPFYSELFDRSC